MQKKKKKIRIDRIWLALSLLSLTVTLAYAAYLLQDYLEDAQTLKAIPQAEYERLGYSKEEAAALNAIKDLKLQHQIIQYPVGEITFALATAEDINEEKLVRCEALSMKFPYATIDDIEAMYRKRGEEEADNKFQADMYYIAANKERYLDAESKLDRDNYFDDKAYLRAIVEFVNTNADCGFNENTEPADLTKGLLTLVNKHYTIADNYCPEDLVEFTEDFGSGSLRSEALSALKQLVTACNEENGYHLAIEGSYRNNQQVQKRWDYMYDEYGSQKKANRKAAQATYSEHQLGLAVDFITDDADYYYFDETLEQIWLVQNAGKYGFIKTYQASNKDISGYDDLTWHYRYVGVENAAKINLTGLSFAEYYEFYVK